MESRILVLGTSYVYTEPEAVRFQDECVDKKSILYIFMTTDFRSM